jgi:hypothetical protein
MCRHTCNSQWCTPTTEEKGKAAVQVLQQVCKDRRLLHALPALATLAPCVHQGGQCHCLDLRCQAWVEVLTPNPAANKQYTSSTGNIIQGSGTKPHKSTRTHSDSETVTRTHTKPLSYTEWHPSPLTIGRGLNMQFVALPLCAHTHTHTHTKTQAGCMRPPSAHTDTHT